MINIRSYVNFIFPGAINDLITCIYPHGDPKNRKPEEFLQQIIKKRIEYFFMQINKSTEKMTAVFKDLYPGQEEKERRKKRKKKRRKLKLLTT